MPLLGFACKQLIIDYLTALAQAGPEVRSLLLTPAKDAAPTGCSHEAPTSASPATPEIPRGLSA